LRGRDLLGGGKDRAHHCDEREMPMNPRLDDLIGYVCAWVFLLTPLWLILISLWEAVK
jgi:hypothetical protein